MKKFVIIWLTAVFLLCCVPVMAEESSSSRIVTIDEGLDISFIVPEGYTFNEMWFSGVLYADFEPADGASASMVLSAGASEEYADRSIQDLSDDELQALMDLAAGDFYNPTLTITETAHGTKLILADENSDYDEYAEIFTVYQGYFIGMLIEPQGDAQLTEGDIQTAVDVLSDMEFVSR